MELLDSIQTFEDVANWRETEARKRRDIEQLIENTKKDANTVELEFSDLDIFTVGFSEELKLVELSASGQDDVRQVQNKNHPMTVKTVAKAARVAKEVVDLVSDAIMTTMQWEPEEEKVFAAYWSGPARAALEAQAQSESSNKGDAEGDHDEDGDAGASGKAGEMSDFNFNFIQDDENPG